MTEENLYPNWFKNVLIFIALWTISKELTRSVEIKSNILFAIFYPFLLLICFFLARPQKDPVFGEGKYFFNISMSIIFFFSFILCGQYKNAVIKIGNLMGGNFTLYSDSDNPEYDDFGRPYLHEIVVNKNPQDLHLYYVSNLIYILIVVYFIGISYYLSKKIKRFEIVAKEQKRSAMIEKISLLRNQ